MCKIIKKNAEGLTDNVREVDSPVNRNSFLKTWIYECVLIYSLWLIANQLVLYNISLWIELIAWFFCGLSIIVFINMIGNYPVLWFQKANMGLCHFVFSFFGKKKLFHAEGMDESKKRPVNHTKVTIIWAILLLVFHVLDLLVAPVLISGNSMSPTLKDGQLVWIKKWPLGRTIPELGFPFFDQGRSVFNKLPDIQRGDIVLFHLPHVSASWMIKRVIGRSGDHFEFTKEGILINNKPVRETWLVSGTKTTPVSRVVAVNELPGYYSELGAVAEYSARFGIGSSGRVPNHMLLVLGDNRNESIDSRSFGYLPKSAIEGILIQ